MSTLPATSSPSARRRSPTRSSIASHGAPGRRSMGTVSVDRPARSGEFDLIRRYFAPLAARGETGLGLRDDAALFVPEPGRHLARKTVGWGKSVSARVILG